MVLFNSFTEGNLICIPDALPFTVYIRGNEEQDKSQDQNERKDGSFCGDLIVEAADLKCVFKGVEYPQWVLASITKQLEVGASQNDGLISIDLDADGLWDCGIVLTDGFEVISKNKNGG